MLSVQFGAVRLIKGHPSDIQTRVTRLKQENLIEEPAFYATLQDDQIVILDGPHAIDFALQHNRLQLEPAVISPGTAPELAKNVQSYLAERVRLAPEEVEIISAQPKSNTATIGSHKKKTPPNNLLAWIKSRLA